MSWVSSVQTSVLLAACLSQLACLDSLLEAPLILTTGLPTVHGMAPTLRGSILVATEEGLWEVQSDGKQRQLTLQPVQDVTTHPESLTLLSEGIISWGPYPEPAADLKLSGRIPAPHAQQLQAWFDGSVMIGQIGSIQQLNRESGESQRIAEITGDLIDIGLGGNQHDSPVLVHTNTGLHRVTASGVTSMEVPAHLQGASLDVRDRLWLVYGEPSQLSIQDKARLKPVSSSVGSLRSMTLGRGGALPSDALYIATDDGSIEYIRVPSP
jgi:hypothetical protein